MTVLETGIRIGGRYQLLERIGDGGHAEVWAALDEDRQRVALKFLHPHLCTTSEALMVLRHEAQMARRLAHPGVLRTGEPQQDGDRVFLPMEYAAGGDLKRLRGASYVESVPVLMRVAAILAHAHALGLVHRDIKPGNVLFDADGHVRLADFGTSTLCGSAQTLAAGSPFSASPQQLVGEPACSADDIYGLGALAYELLSGYPPYYPDFDPVRVQSQMPPPVRPVLPAPPRLTRLVMAMLAREPQRRPSSMEAVIEVLGEALADTLSVEATGTAMIAEREPPPAISPQSSKPLSRWPRVAVVMAVALAAVAVGYWAMRGKPPDGVQADSQIAVPDTSPEPSSAARPAESGPEAGSETEPESVGALAPEETLPAAPQPVLTDADREAAAAEAAARQFDREVEAGQQALSRGQPVLARMAFERARQLRPGAVEVTLGFDAAARLERVLQLHTEGVQAETAGQFALARDRFAAALALDGRFEPAIEGRNRVQARLQERERIAAQRASDAERNAQNQRDQRVGMELEAAERWRDAQTLYQAVLDRDPGAGFARTALERAQQRAAFAAQVADFIDRPARLSERSVRLAATQALSAGRALQPAGPRLTQQLSQLESLLAAQEATARVEILSDSSTQVRIARVGDLGSFESRELDLPPGNYTVIGTRQGYRDVRRELVIRPGQRTATLAVACMEPI